MAGGGKSRVWNKAVKVNRLRLDVMAAKAESGPKGRAARVGNPDLNSATSDSTNTFIYGTVTQSPLLSPSVGQIKEQKRKPRKVKCAAKMP